MELKENGDALVGIEDAIGAAIGEADCYPRIDRLLSVILEVLTDDFRGAFSFVLPLPL